MKYQVLFSLKNKEKIFLEAAVVIGVLIINNCNYPENGI